MSSTGLEHKQGGKIVSNEYSKKKTLKTIDTTNKSLNPSRYSWNSGFKNSPIISQYNSKTIHMKEANEKEL